MSLKFRTTLELRVLLLAARDCSLEECSQVALSHLLKVWTVSSD